jgi:hypothetical protein
VAISSLVNDVAQSIDTLTAPDGTGRYKLAVGSVDVGLDADSAWHGVATHVDGDAFVASDGIVVIGGVDPTDVPRKALTDDDGRMEFVASGWRGAVTDASSTLTAGGTAEDALASNLTRRWLFIQNVDDTEDLWVDIGTDAVTSQPSIRLVAKAMLVFDGNFVPTARISVVADTTDHPYVAKDA